MKKLLDKFMNLPVYKIPLGFLLGIAALSAFGATTTAIYLHHERSTLATLEADLQNREIGLDITNKTAVGKFSDGTKFHLVSQEEPNVSLTGTLAVTGAASFSNTVTNSFLTPSRLLALNASSQYIANPALTANGFVYPTASGALASTAATTNGQILIGATSAAPIAGTLTGTTNQVIVTNGVNSITLATPQNIHTGASPTFAGLTISGNETVGKITATDSLIGTVHKGTKAVFSDSVIGTVGKFSSNIVATGTSTFVNSTNSGTLGITGATTINSSIALSEKLGVAGSTNNGGVVRIENAVNSTDVNHGILNLVNTATYGVGNDARIMFSFKGIGGGSGTIDPVASMGAVCEGAALAYQSALVFNTRSSAGAFSEKMRLSSGGNLSVTGITTATGGVTFGNSSPTNLNAYQEGTFTVTITGCTTSPTGTASYVLIGKHVTLILPPITAASNSTALTYTGLPAGLQSATTQLLALNEIANAGSSANAGVVQVGASGTLTFRRTASAAGFTNDGLTKGLATAQTISYNLQ